MSSSSFSPQQLHQALHTSFTATNESTRQQAEQYLKTFTLNASFLPQSFEIIASGGQQQQDTWSQQDRLAFTVFIKNTIFSWNQDDFIQKHASILQKHVVELLYRIVTEMPIRNVVMTIIRRLLSVAQWPNFDSMTFEMLSSAGNDTNKMQCGLLLMNELTKQLEISANKNQMEQFFTKFESLLVQLYDYLLNQTVQNHQQQESFAFIQLMNMRYNIVKSMWHVLRKDTAPTWLQDAQKFRHWNQLFLKGFQMEKDLFGGALAERYSADKHFIWKEKRLIAHLLYIFLLRSLDIRKKPTNQEEERKRALGQLFRDEYAPQYLQLYIQLIEQVHQNAAKRRVPNRNMSPLIVFLDSSIQDGNIYNKIWLPNLESFFSKILLPFVALSQDDFSLMMDDANQFMAIHFEENDDVYSTRVAALQVLYELVGLRQDTALEVFFRYISQQMGNSNTNAPQRDAMIASLIHLKRVLDLHDQKVLSYLGQFITQYIFPAMSAQEPYLCARANAFLGSYLMLCVQDQSVQHQAVQLILNSLQHKNLVVKTQAAIAISELIQHDEICAQLKPLLSQLLQSYLSIMSQVDNSTLVASLSNLVQNFADEMQPYAVQTCSSTVDVFMRLCDQEDEEGLLYDTCMECLRTLYTLLSAVLPTDDNTSNATIFTQLEPKILPLIVQILKDESLSFLEEGLELLTLYTYCSHSLSENVWKVFPILIEQYYELELFDYLPFLLAPLDNYISHGTQTFLSHADYVQKILSLIERYLKVDTVREKDCHSAAKLLSVMLQNCVGGHIDSHLPGILSMVLHKLQICKTTSLRILLLDCIGDSMFYNAPLTVQILDQNQCTQQLLQNWFETIEKMTRVYDKRVSAIGLIRMLETSVDAQGANNSVPQVAAQLVSRVVSLLSNIHQQQREIEQNQMQMEEQRKNIVEQLEQRNGSYQESIEKLLQGGDDGSDDVRDSITSTQFFKGIMEELQNVNSYDACDPSDDVLEEENISTPLDDVNEYSLFGQVMLRMNVNRGDLFQRVVGQLDEETKQGMNQLISNASQ